MASEIFILDADTLITPYQLFYPFDMFPDFWIFIEQKLASNEIKILDMVYNEITMGNDPLSNWLSSLKNIEISNHKESAIITQYGYILDYIHTCPFYKMEALNAWSLDNTADPWLIATAITYHYTIITFEKPNASLNDKQPSKDAKIPDICRQFDVKFNDLYYMMRQLGFRNTESIKASR